MAKFNIDIIVLGERSSVPPGSPEPLRRDDLYEKPTGKAAELRCRVFGYHDGVALKRPSVAPDGILELHCNECQFEPIQEAIGQSGAGQGVAGQAVAGQVPKPIFVYFNSETDAGIHFGKDPFESAAPVSF